ncbi:MAG: alpha/beta hydrolase [Phycisphaerae bacterium]
MSKSRRTGIIPAFLIILAGVPFVSVLHAEEKVKKTDIQKSVQLRTADGLVIFADFYPAERKVDSAPFVILLHMYQSDRSAWQPMIEPLRNSGFAVLALDLRGHGESGTTGTTRRVEERDPEIFREMQDDVRATYDWVVQQPRVDRSRFALLGASVGCSVAIQYAAKDKSVDVVACLTPGTNYLGLNTEEDIRQIQGRKILLVAVEGEREAAEQLGKLCDGATAKIYRGEGHGTNMFAGVTRAIPETVSFLLENVGKPSGGLVYGTINSNIYHLPDSKWIPEIGTSNLRVYSSAQEAESRGLRKSKSKGPRDGGRRSSGR